MPRTLASLLLVFACIRGEALAQPRSSPPPAATPPIGYFIADGNPAEHYRPGDRQLAAWAIAAWQRAAGSTLRLTPAAEAVSQVRLYWAGPLSGQYGEMRPLIVDGRRGAAVFIRPDTSALGPEIAALAANDLLLRDTIVYLTCVHELGHAFGLEHTADFRDIMYSFQYGGDIVEYFGRFRRQLQTRDDIATRGGMSEEDVRRIRALYPSDR